MTIPIALTEVTSPAVTRRGYLAASIDGLMTFPTDATAAALEPEIAPKTVAVPTVVTPSAPGTPATKECTKSTRRCETVPRDISSPA